MTQHIRASQFITTYGPGSILEGPNGPRIILSPDIGLFIPIGRSPAEFIIIDQRISNGLLYGAKIFRLPSNAELGMSQLSHIYKTKPFPNWVVCLNSKDHSGRFYILFKSDYKGSSCPVCKSSERFEPIRFIRACPKGHLDDIDWNYFVHSTSKCSHSKWFRWYGGGGALKNIVVECPRCEKRSISMGKAYGETWPCSGRYPEREHLVGRINQRSSNCTKAKIVQRQASNLRIPETKTLFSISRKGTKLHEWLEYDSLYDNFVNTEPASKEQLKGLMENLTKRNRLPQKIMNSILNCPWEEIKKAIKDVMANPPSTYDEMLLEEFDVLIDASINGAPPKYSPSPTAQIIFEVDPNEVKTFKKSIGNMRVTPILKLQTITLQTSYRREVDQMRGERLPAESVSIDFNWPPGNKENQWYPGTDFLGEGIFIIFDSNDMNSFDPSLSSAKEWKKASENRSPLYTSSPLIFRGSKHEELNPMFVWWHTLSHLLIRAISEESGYSSSSIRERIYLKSDGEGEKGGILLYATQPGSEGTLGGLIALVPHFNHILDVALEYLYTCSGGPLCLDNRFIDGKYNGAACPGCLLISETSCEHRNMWLDRKIIIEGLD